MPVYRYVAIFLIVVFFGLVLLAHYFATHKKHRRAYIGFLYVIGIIYIIGQGIFYSNAMPDSSPDETAHISYIYYLNKTDEIIPHFEDMHLLYSEKMKWSEDYFAYDESLVNYLCHPPLYYQIMCLAGGIYDTEDPSVAQLDKPRLRYFNLIIYVIGVCLLLYIESFIVIFSVNSELHYILLVFLQAIVVYQVIEGSFYYINYILYSCELVRYLLMIRNKS